MGSSDLCPPQACKEEWYDIYIYDIDVYTYVHIHVYDSSAFCLSQSLSRNVRQILSKKG